MRMINPKMMVMILLYTSINGITCEANGQIQQDSVLTLKDCIRLGIANSHKLKLSQIESDKNHYKYKEALSSGFPQISGFASLENYFDIPVTMVSGDIIGQAGTMIPIQLGTKYNANAGIKAGQMIYNATYFATLKLFKNLCEISHLEFQKNKEDIAYNIAQIYTFIQISNVQLSLIDSNLLAFKKVSEYSEQHYKNGLISKIDFDRVSVNMNNLELEKENALLTRNQQLNMLKYLIGIDQNQSIIISDDLEIKTIPLLLEDSLFTGHTDILISEQKKELSRLNQKLTSSENIPTLTAYAAYSYQSQRERFDLFKKEDYWYKTSFIGINLSIPLFEGGRVKNKLLQNRIEIDQANIGQLDLQRELQVNFINATQKLNTNKSLELKLKNNMRVAENIFTLMNEQYGQGLKSFTEVLNARTEFNASQVYWLQVLMQIKLTELEIIKITGKISFFFLQ